MSTLVNSSSNTTEPSTVQSRRPDFRVRENEREALIRVYLPGVSKEAINLNFERGTLSLKAIGETEVPEGWEVLHRERSGPAFDLSLSIGKGFDADQLSAEWADGVLSIQVPRQAEALPRQISVV